MPDEPIMEVRQSEAEPPLGSCLLQSNTCKWDYTLAQPNYQYEKRQKELAKKKKKAEKELRKSGKTETPSTENPNPSPGEGETPVAE
jgi:hypothetical protein